MNKYKVLIFSILYLLMASIVANELGLSASQIDTTFTQPDTGLLGVLSWAEFAFNSVGFFFKMITFQITGLPVLFVLILIWPVTALLFVVIVSIVRGVE